MNPLLSHKKCVGMIFLFFFVFSANALCYGSHFNEEFGHDHAATANNSGNNNSSDSSSLGTLTHYHDDSQEESHEDDESCCDGHSHAFNLYRPICYKYVPHNTSRTIVEPFKFIPEVFLDKFIPPQNLA